MSRFKFRKLLLLGLISSNCFMLPAFAVDFGRTTTSGVWNDGNWNNALGVAGTPNASSGVYVGQEDAAAGWVAPASVAVNTFAQADRIYIGSSGGAEGSVDVVGGGTLFANGVTVYAGSLNLNGGTLGIDSVYATGALSTVTLNGTVGGLQSLYLDSGAAASINAATAASNAYVYDGTLNVNAALDVSGGAIYTYGATINQSADIAAGDLYLGYVFGSASTLNRTGGSLTLNRLTLEYGSSIVLGAGDTVASSVYVNTGSTFELTAELVLTDGLYVTDSTATVQAVSAANRVALDNATLNMNGDISTQALDLRNANTINRIAGSSITTEQLNLYSQTYAVDGTDTITGGIYMEGSTVSINAVTNLSGGGLLEAYSSLLTINAATTASQMGFFFGGTLNVNAALDVSGGAIYTDGATINQSADITTDHLYLGYSFGNASTLNRTGGSLTLDRLTLANGSSATLGAGDTVASSVSVNTGSTFESTAELVLTDGLYVTDSTATVQAVSAANRVALDNATLNMNGDISTQVLALRNTNTINRSEGSSITTDQLDLYSQTYAVDGTTTVTGGIYMDNSTVSIDTTLNLSGNGLYVDGNSSLTVNATTTALNTNVFNSTLNVNATLDVSGGTIFTDGATINQSADITTDHLYLGYAFGNASTLNRTGGSLTLDRLTLANGSSATLGAGDTVTDLSISNSSAVSYRQSGGSMEGLDLNSLTISADSTLFIDFESSRVSISSLSSLSSTTIDWGLRLSGDQQSLLLAYVVGGQLFGSDPQAVVFYDEANFGNFTYFGTYSLATVPEPACGGLLSIAIVGWSLRRRRV